MDLFGASPFRFIYCIILTSLAADIINDFVKPDFYYHYENEVLDAFMYFGKPVIDWAFGF